MFIETQFVLPGFPISPWLPLSPQGPGGPFSPSLPVSPGSPDRHIHQLLNYDLINSSFKVLTFTLTVMCHVECFSRLDTTVFVAKEDPNKQNNSILS